MKTLTTLCYVCCISFLGLLAGCDRKPAPLKEGVLWKVVWSEKPNMETGLYRETTPLHPEFAGGEYGVDMYGALYPGFLEVRRVGSRDSHSQIIPLRQIVVLEFGDGSVTLGKP